MIFVPQCVTLSGTEELHLGTAVSLFHLTEQGKSSDRCNAGFSLSPLCSTCISEKRAMVKLEHASLSSAEWSQRTDLQHTPWLEEYPTSTYSFFCCTHQTHLTLFIHGKRGKCARQVRPTLTCYYVFFKRGDQKFQQLCHFPLIVFNRKQKCSAQSWNPRSWLSSQ